jgi:hypothetical protein
MLDLKKRAYPGSCGLDAETILIMSNLAGTGSLRVVLFVHTELICLLLQVLPLERWCATPSSVPVGYFSAAHHSEHSLSVLISITAH